MTEFRFAKNYFHTLLFDDPESNIRVIVKEKPSFEVMEEEYSLRVETHHEETGAIHRKYAIEHHSKQDKHNYPHLQFKFHTEEIGTFRLRLDFNSTEEYQRAILGFIYKIKNVLADLERFRKGILSELMILEKVDQLSAEGEFLSLKIAESISQVEFDMDGKYTRDKVQRLNQNPLLLDFIGQENVEKLTKNYTKHL